MSRALPGGMLNSKEKTEYEDWLEKKHQEIDKHKTEKDCCPQVLMDSECGENGYHNYDGSVMTDKNRVHGIFEDVYYGNIRKGLSDSLKKVTESLNYVCFLTSHLTEGDEDEKVLLKRDQSIKHELWDAKERLIGFKRDLKNNHTGLVNILSQSFVYDVEDCLKAVCESIDKILSLPNTHKDIVLEAIKDLADESNSIIKELNDSILQLPTLTELKLKNLDGSLFLGSFSNLMEFNQKVLGDKYAKINELSIAA